ncbi:hypothetical protein C7974DRAFT_413065 [Boeremia exigua]|uniref:uncharacterized protein n=1 Tax=Boeremia exigua TaxID=749465 RepID=UPI001E8E5092|nr:uncharacterized protein C7974DRAFT_413065 [Boeremia exigua]KAH6629251.1 hypothetical protein C7974DRAFT_413065 [Boeremia exigua]
MDDEIAIVSSYSIKSAAGSMPSKVDMGIGAGLQADGKAYSPINGISPPICDSASETELCFAETASAKSDSRTRHDSLDVSVREYVDSKTTKALHEPPCNCPSRTPLNLVVKFGLESVGEMPTSSLKRFPIDTNIFFGPKRVGPFVLPPSSNTYHVQLGIIGVYTLIILFSAIIGPKTMFLTVWRLSVSLICYAMLGRFLGYNVETRQDFLLAPGLYVAGHVQKFLFSVRFSAKVMPKPFAILDPKQ